MTRRTWRHDDGIADGGAVAAKRSRILDTAGDDRLEGTRANDFFYITEGGNDTAFGRHGDDKFFFYDTFTTADRVDGGRGKDVIYLQGTYPDTLQLDLNVLDSVEKVIVSAERTYDIKLADGFDFLKIVASKPEGGTVLNVDASDLTTGRVWLEGASSNEVLIGSAGNDLIQGWFGPDTLTGGPGADKFRYFFTFESSEQFSTPDTITDFARDDVISLPTNFKDGISYHVGETPERVGDVLLSYDAEQDRTTVRAFLDQDDVADTVIWLSGRHLDLRIIHDVDLIQI